MVLIQPRPCRGRTLDAPNRSLVPVRPFQGRGSLSARTPRVRRRRGDPGLWDGTLSGFVRQKVTVLPRRVQCPEQLWYGPRGLPRLELVWRQEARTRGTSEGRRRAVH